MSDKFTRLVPGWGSAVLLQAMGRIQQGAVLRNKEIAYQLP